MDIAAGTIVKPVICRKETLKIFFSSIIGCIGIVIICLICDFGWESIIGENSWINYTFSNYLWSNSYFIK